MGSSHDANRARAQLAEVLAAPVASTARVPIWGNHSAERDAVAALGAP